jgi:hypothetical protein
LFYEVSPGVLRKGGREARDILSLRGIPSLSRGEARTGLSYHGLMNRWGAVSRRFIKIKCVAKPDLKIRLP